MIEGVSRKNECTTAIQQEIATAVQAIREGHERDCHYVTGTSLSDLEIADRREQGRYEICLPFYLTPMPQNESLHSSGEEMHGRVGNRLFIAVSRDLSPRGIGFRCDEPVPLGYVLAEFDSQRTGCIKLLLEIRWRRRQSLHNYLAGARIDRVLSETGTK